MLNHVSIDKRKYKTDSISYWLTILGVLANVFYFITLYRRNNNFYYSYKMGISIVYNLVFMLLVFLSAEEIKYYRRPFSVLLVLVGLLQIARIFYYPKQAFEAKVLPADAYLAIKIYLIISAVLLITAGIISFVNSTILKRYIEGKLKLPPIKEV